MYNMVALSICFIKQSHLYFLETSDVKHMGKQKCFPLKMEQHFSSVTPLHSMCMISNIFL